MDDVTRTYDELLSNENRTRLTEVAARICANVVGTAIEVGLIEDSPAWEAAEVPTDLLMTRGLFSTRFDLAAGPESGPVHYRALGHAFHQNRHSLGREPDQVFRLRAQMVPALYDLVREHRNLNQHVNNSGTPTRVISLCGAILGILDLSTPGVDSDSLRQQCESAVLTVAEGLTEQRDQDRRESGSETSEPPRAEKRRTEELEAEVEQLRAEVGRLKRQQERPKIRLKPQARNRRLDAIDSTINQIATRLHQVVSETRSGFAEANEIARGVDRKIGLLNETIAHAQRDVASGEDRGDGDIPYSDTGWGDAPRVLTVAMAREQLRQLRNRIDAGGGVQPWQNICMVSPIVDTALDVAAQTGLSTVDEWLAVDIVQQRYARHTEVMDRQIKDFGEEMMDIYRQVERVSDRDAQREADEMPF